MDKPKTFLWPHEKIYLRAAFEATGRSEAEASQLVENIEVDQELSRRARAWLANARWRMGLADKPGALAEKLRADLREEASR